MASRRIVEAIGIIGVVGSLVFVGVEIRQNSIATRAATDADIADSFRELSLAQATSPALASAFAAHATDRQHLNGTVDPAIYDSVVREISSYAGSPSTAEPPSEIGTTP